jgi:hypothetical protein
MADRLKQHRYAQPQRPHVRIGGSLPLSVSGDRKAQHAMTAYSEVMLDSTGQVNKNRSCCGTLPARSGPPTSTASALCVTLTAEQLDFRLCAIRPESQEFVNAARPGRSNSSGAPRSGQSQHRRIHAQIGSPGLWGAYRVETTVDLCRSQTWRFFVRRSAAATAKTALPPRIVPHRPSGLCRYGFLATRR